METLILTESQCFHLIDVLHECGRFNKATKEDLYQILKAEFAPSLFPISNTVVLKYETTKREDGRLNPGYYWSFYVKQPGCDLLIDQTSMYGDLTQEEFDAVHGFCKSL